MKKTLISGLLLVIAIVGVFALNVAVSYGIGLLIGQPWYVVFGVIVLIRFATNQVKKGRE